MKNKNPIIGIFLILHLAGCTAFRQVGIPEVSAPSDLQEQEQQELSIGDSVRITLNCGTVHTGNIVTIAPEEIKIGKNGNFGYQERAIPILEIASLEVEGIAGPFGLLRGTAIIFGVFVGTVVVLLLTVAKPSFG